MVFFVKLPNQQFQLVQIKLHVDQTKEVRQGVECRRDQSRVCVENYKDQSAAKFRYGQTSTYIKNLLFSYQRASKRRL